MATRQKRINKKCHVFFFSGMLLDSTDMLVHLKDKISSPIKNVTALPV